MPEQKSVATAPSPGFFERMFGSSPLTPNMQRGIEIARKENPNIQSVEPYGPISRLFNSDANAYVNPTLGKTIYVNPAHMGSMSPEQVADTLAHEGTHLSQMQREGNTGFTALIRSMFSGPRGPHHQRPEEMEAYQVEAQRRARMGRPAEPRMNMSGQVVTPKDVNLPLPRKSTAPTMGSPMFSNKVTKTM